jgi:methylated-DNA-[protein]-cysteine S-methyltransferase
MKPQVFRFESIKAITKAIASRLSSPTKLKLIAAAQKQSLNSAIYQYSWPMKTAQWKADSPIGTLYLSATNAGLTRLFWEQGPEPFVDSLDSDQPEIQVLRETVWQLNEYFSGKLKQFSIPLDLKPTPFQKLVWAELERIPFGETASYSEIAKRIGKPAAMRAVGTANGKNPVCIVTPCHRVVAANGTVGGYSGGLAAKESLLKLEQLKLERDANH